jgi:peptidoglycan/LPS O-acetylase OafA/YrhL
MSSADSNGLAYRESQPAARHSFTEVVQASTSAPFAVRARGIDSLTGIRGVAAVYVFLTHYQTVMAAYLQSPAIEQNLFLYNGFRGVDLFFVLSGFILMHVHGEEFRSYRAEALSRFYILRFFRVYPLNTAVLLALLPIYFCLPDLVTWFRVDHGVPIPYHSHDFSVAGFVQSLFLAQTWTVLKLGEWNGPAWSLSAEVFGYALFPVLAHFLIRRRSPVGSIGYAVASLGILMLLLAMFGHTQDSPTGSFGLIRMIFGFVAGMAMARCFQLWPEAKSWANALAIASVVVIVATLSVRYINMFVVFGFCGLIFALAYQKGIINTLLSSRPAMFLGRISFSLYMIHYVPLKMSLWLLQTRLADSGLAVRVACLISVAGLCLCLAVATHLFLELRFQRYGRLVLRGGLKGWVQAASA